MPSKRVWFTLHARWKTKPSNGNLNPASQPGLTETESDWTEEGGWKSLTCPYVLAGRWEQVVTKGEGFFDPFLARRSSAVLQI